MSEITEIFPLHTKNSIFFGASPLKSTIKVCGREGGRHTTLHAQVRFQKVVYVLKFFVEHQSGISINLHVRRFIVQYPRCLFEQLSTACQSRELPALDRLNFISCVRICRDEKCVSSFVCQLQFDCDCFHLTKWNQFVSMATNSSFYFKILLRHLISLNRTFLGVWRATVRIDFVIVEHAELNKKDKSGIQRTKSISPFDHFQKEEQLSCDLL